MSYMRGMRLGPKTTNSGCRAAVPAPYDGRRNGKEIKYRVGCKCTWLDYGSHCSFQAAVYAVGLLLADPRVKGEDQCVEVKLRAQIRQNLKPTLCRLLEYEAALH
jgi:hypothetical protein